MTTWHPGDPDRRTNPRSHVSADENFQGYVTARLEDIARVQGEQRQEVMSVKADVAAVRVEIGALRATARAWGIFAGILSGVLTSVAGKLWRP